MNVIILLMFLVSSTAFASEQILTICLTGSTEKALPEYGEAFVNGATLALNEVDQVDRAKVKLEVHYYDSSPLAPLEKLKEMRQASCDAIIGFSTGNDLLAIEDSLKEKPILTFSIYGDPQERYKQTRYLRTMQPSAEELVEYMFKKKPFKLKEKSKVLLVTAIDRSEMQLYRLAYLKFLRGKADITYADVVEQTHDIRAVKDILQRDSKWDFIVLLTRSLLAAEITDLLKADKRPIILGTKYFGSPDLPAYYNFLKNKKVEAYIPRQNCTCDTDERLAALRHKYFKTFSKKPMSISLDTYDATKFILEALKAPIYTPEEVINFLNSLKKPFIGSSSLLVTEGLNVSTKKRYVLKIDETGYREFK